MKKKILSLMALLLSANYMFGQVGHSAVWTFNQYPREGEDIEVAKGAGVVFDYSGLKFYSNADNRTFSAKSIKAGQDIEIDGKTYKVYSYINNSAAFKNASYTDETKPQSVMHVETSVSGTLYVAMQIGTGGTIMTFTKIVDGNSTKEEIDITPEDGIKVVSTECEAGIVRFGANKGNNVYAVVFKPSVTPTAGASSIVISNTGYATFSSKYSHAVPSGLTAYVASKYDKNAMTMTPISSIPAGTPVVLKGNAGTYDLTITEDITPYSETNNLKPVLADYALAATNGASGEAKYTNFVLAKNSEGSVCFMKSTGTGNIAANKAYLQILTSNLPAEESEARSISFNFVDNEATGIEDNILNVNNSDATIYDLMGRKVLNPTKGLYINNGKKVIIK